MLDAAECGPTFGTDLVRGLIAGGPAALTEAIEGAEDAFDLADLADLTAADALVGITASGRTPYVLGALEHARAAGALTVAIVNNPGSEASADLVIELLTGPEVLAGSTRLTAGTAQKVVLNALSTSVMIALGKAYGPRMVDVRPTSAKLRRRAVRIVRDAAGVDEDAAAAALAAAGGHAKTAIVALLTGVDAAEAAISALQNQSSALNDQLSDARRTLATIDPIDTEVGKRWPAAFGPAPELAVQDGACTPLADGQFDIVTISAVLHHVPPAERQAVYRELGRVLKPGGRIYVFEHNPRNPLVRYVIARTPIDENAILLDEKEVRHGLLDSARYDIASNYLMFMPPGITFLRGVDRLLAWLPLGAQYVVAARKGA